MNQHATAARFQGARDRRHRGIQAKIMVAKKQLQLAEDDYRQILIDETGKASSRDCSVRELEAVIRRLEGLGFKPLPAKGAKRAAQHPVARKARAIWISLYHLGAVRNPSDKAMEAFACRQLGCERLVWARQSDGNKLIEALKAMAEKAGWSQTDANGNNRTVLNLKICLCEAILAKLAEAGEVPSDWDLSVAAWRLAGIDMGGEGPVTAEGYDTLAKVLGDTLRAARKGGAA